jgi:hypothetical protein
MMINKENPEKLEGNPAPLPLLHHKPLTKLTRIDLKAMQREASAELPELWHHLTIIMQFVTELYVTTTVGTTLKNKENSFSFCLLCA